MLRTRNVIFPSSKKYTSCRLKESSVVACPPIGVFAISDNSGRLVCFAPRSALLSTGVGDICEKVEYVSENVESNETMEAALERIEFVVTPGGLLDTFRRHTLH